MAKRQREWAKRAKRELLLRLGGRCRFCGEGDLTLLVPNHINPASRTWSARSGDMSWRVSQYRKDEKAGLLECACIDCNNSLGNRNGGRRTREELLREFDDPVPF